MEVKRISGDVFAVRLTDDELEKLYKIGEKLEDDGLDDGTIENVIYAAIDTVEVNSINLHPLFWNASIQRVVKPIPKI